ncbi:MAG: hypothetical protein KA160_06845 [Lacibacter sp.]|nr:hypothetical protein [Lacibacter sp.]
MLIHLLVIGTIVFLFVTIQWLSRRKQLKLRQTTTQQQFHQKQEAAA